MMHSNQRVENSYMHYLQNHKYRGGKVIEKRNIQEITTQGSTKPQESSAQPPKHNFVPTGPMTSAQLSRTASKAGGIVASHDISTDLQPAKVETKYFLELKRRASKGGVVKQQSNSISRQRSSSV